MTRIVYVYALLKLGFIFIYFNYNTAFLGTGAYRPRFFYDNFDTNFQKTAFLAIFKQLRQAHEGSDTRLQYLLQ